MAFPNSGLSSIGKGGIGKGGIGKGSIGKGLTVKSQELQDRLSAAMSMLSEADAEDIAPVIAARIVTVQEDRELWRTSRAPLPFDEFCTALDGCPMFPRQLRAFSQTGRLDPKCWVTHGQPTQEFVLVWGKGSGKDYLAAKVTCYVAYINQSLRRDPATHYGVAPYSTLSIINVAPTEKQARTIFFRYLSGFMRSNVMKPFVPDPRRQIMADEIKFFRYTLDGAEYQPIAIESMHSRAASLEGKNVIWWTMDEADAFLDSGDKSNADEIHEILRSSASTRFSGFWGGMVITYPRVAEGFIMRLVERAKANTPLFYWDLAPTWEVNPRFNREAPEVLSDYQDNPSHARALYECIPQATLDGFFEFPERIDLATDPAIEPVAVVMQEPFEMTSGESLLRYINVKMLGNNRKPGHTYFLGGDAGTKKDAYAIAIFHTQDALEAVAYICPECAREDPEVLTFAPYVQQPINTVVPFSDSINCPFCFRDTTETWTQAPRDEANATLRLDGWWVREDLHTEDGPAEYVHRGSTLSLPHVYEDLIVRVKPFHATRQGEFDRLVYLPGIEKLCTDLINTLGIRSARFDPHQALQVVQSLQNATNCDVGEISFNNTEQMRRGRLVKAMLYAGKITLLANKERDREWRRLMLVGGSKLDHPEHGEKDVWDAEAIAIWLAAINKNSELALSFT